MQQQQRQQQNETVTATVKLGNGDNHSAAQQCNAHLYSNNT